MRYPALCLLAFAFAHPLALAASAHQRRANQNHRELARRAKGDLLNKRDIYNDARWTFYSTGLGACGGTNSDSDFIVALNQDTFGTVYPSKYCYKQITMTYNGKTTTATIVDSCPGCPSPGGLDLSPGLFSFFADESVGVLYGDWSFVDDSDTTTSTTQQKTTTAAPPPPPPVTTTHTTTHTTTTEAKLTTSTAAPVAPKETTSPTEAKETTSTAAPAAPKETTTVKATTEAKPTSSTTTPAAPKETTSPTEAKETTSTAAPAAPKETTTAKATTKAKPTTTETPTSSIVQVTPTSSVVKVASSSVVKVASSSVVSSAAAVPTTTPAVVGNVATQPETDSAPTSSTAPAPINGGLGEGTGEAVALSFSSALMGAVVLTVAAVLA